MNFQPKLPSCAVALAIGLFLVLPSVIVIPASLTDLPYLSLPKNGLSFQHYVRLFHNQDWLRSFLTSVGTSLCAAVIATALGTLFSIGSWKLASLGSSVLQALLLLPMVVPGIVSALALYLVWTKLGIYDTLLGVVLVQAIVGIPFVVVSVSTALASLNTTQVQASRSLGAGPWRTLMSVVLPSLRGAIFTGFILALVTGWDEAVITLFVTGRSVQVLPRKIWDSLRYDIDPIVSVVAAIMVIVTSIVVLVFMWSSHRRGHSQKREVF